MGLLHLKRLWVMDRLAGNKWERLPLRVASFAIVRPNFRPGRSARIQKVPETVWRLQFVGLRLPYPFPFPFPF